MSPLTNLKPQERVLCHITRPKGFLPYFLYTRGIMILTLMPFFLLWMLYDNFVHYFSLIHDIKKTFAVHNDGAILLIGICIYLLLGCVVLFYYALMAQKDFFCTLTDQSMTLNLAKPSSTPIHFSRESIKSIHIKYNRCSKARDLVNIVIIIHNNTIIPNKEQPKFKRIVIAGIATKDAKKLVQLLNDHT